MSTKKGFGLACTVLYTELREAVIADGGTLPEKAGDHVAAHVRKIVSDYFEASAQETPVVVVDASGGAWHSVRASSKVHVLLVDYDSEQDDVDLVLLPQGSAYCAVMTPEGDNIDRLGVREELDIARAALEVRDLREESGMSGPVAGN